MRSTNYTRSVTPPESLRRVVVDAATAERFRAWLASPTLYLQLPRELVPPYHRYRMRDLVRYLRVGAPLLSALIITLSLLQPEFFHGALGSDDARLWRLGTMAACVVLVGAAGLVQLRAVQRHYELVASPIASLVLMKLTVFSQLLGNPAAARIESYFCMLTVFLVTVALRFRLVVAAASVFGSGAIALGLIVWLAARPDMRAFAYYYGAATSLGLFVAWQLEEKEKTAFLQAVLIEHDARALDAMNAELVRLSRHDALTGLANRRELERRLELEWERLRREGRSLAIVFADIDYFKAFNDHYGHAAGDACIARVADALRAAILRPADLAARYGGEEFVLVLPDTDEDGAVDVARRAREAIDALAIVHQASGAATKPGHVTLSLGVAAMVPGSDDSVDQVMRLADGALYAAKHQGRHCVVAASSMTDTAGAAGMTAG